MSSQKDVTATLFALTSSQIKMVILNCILVQRGYRTGAMIAIDVSDLTTFNTVMSLFPELMCEKEKVGNEDEDSTYVSNSSVIGYIIFKRDNHHLYLDLMVNRDTTYNSGLFLGYLRPLHSLDVPNCVVLSLIAVHDNVEYEIYKQNIDLAVSTETIIAALSQAQLCISNYLTEVTVAYYVTLH